MQDEQNYAATPQVAFLAIGVWLVASLHDDMYLISTEESYCTSTRFQFTSVLFDPHIGP